MENAIDALKIAFGMLVFVIAISVSVTTFQKAKETSDIMLAINDKTEYIEYEQGFEAKKVRVVGLETIIPTLYKYYKEDYMVVFRKKNNDPYIIYETKTKKEKWKKSYVDTYINGDNIGFNASGGKGIACFDVEEETARGEPWTANTNKYFKENLDAVIKGGEFIFPEETGEKYKYNNGLISKFKNKKFEEYIGEKVYEVENPSTNMMRKTKKRIIIYKEK